MLRIFHRHTDSLLAVKRNECNILGIDEAFVPKRCDKYVIPQMLEMCMRFIVFSSPQRLHTQDPPVSTCSVNQ